MREILCGGLRWSEAPLRPQVWPPCRQITTRAADPAVYGRMRVLFALWVASRNNLRRVLPCVVIGLYSYLGASIK
jgi:hypothetical protein